MSLPESPAVQDTDRLREVARAAMREEFHSPDEGGWPGHDIAEGCAGCHHAAAAVLAAVLPVHREMVLGEAATAIEAHVVPREDTSWGAARRNWFDGAATLVRRLAASTPPTPPSATESAERATAITEGAPTPQESPGAVYRTGRKVGRTIYRDDVLIGVMDTPELAALAVAAMNRAVPEGDDPWRRRIDVSTLYGYELGAGDLAGVEAELVEARRERDEARAERDRLAETNARLEVERDDALALVAACTTRQQRRLAETIRRYEPVIEAAKAWLAYGWNGSARLSAAIRALGDIPSPAAPEASVLSQLDGAMHSIWLHGNWRWLTKNMTTPEKEATLAAVLRHDRAMKADEADLGGELLTEADWAWWREPAPVEPEGTPDADA